MKLITDSVRGYDSSANRKRAIAALARKGFNYFVCFRDVQSTYALLYSKADWVKPSRIYIDK